MQLHGRVRSGVILQTIMAIQDYFQQSETTASTHTWALVSHNPTTLPVNGLACELADRIVKFQCRGALHHYDAWRAKAHDGTLLPDSAQRALNAFFTTVFGTSGDIKTIPRDHLEGYVGQMLWYFLCEEKQSAESILRIQPPGFKATDPGGDGLVIHRLPDLRLMFRLWEMKKFVPTSNTSSSSVASTVDTAYNQLDAKALEYLARYTAIGQELNDVELQEFYGKLVELWDDASDQAAAGVAVATSLAHVPRTCFGTFGQRFPRFIDPVRLRGMLTAIDDFAVFCSKVQEEIWKGL